MAQKIVYHVLGWLISVEKYFLHIVGQMALHVSLEKQEREPQVTFLMGGLLLDVRFSFLSKQIGISQKTILFLYFCELNARKSECPFCWEIFFCLENCFLLFYLGLKV